MKFSTVVLAGMVSLSSFSISANDVYTKEDFSDIIGDSSAYCEYLGVQAHGISQERDQGIEKSEQRSFYAAVIEYDDLLGHIFAVIDTVYEYPRLEPIDEYNNVKSVCMEAFERGGETFTF